MAHRRRAGMQAMRLKIDWPPRRTAKPSRHRMNRHSSAMSHNFVASLRAAIPDNAQHAGAVIVQTIRTPKM
jgi:hypothetical protein